MAVTCACGRCAQKFEIEGDDLTAVRCPQCGFDTCYRIGGMPSASDQLVQSASESGSGQPADAATSAAPQSPSAEEDVAASPPADSRPQPAADATIDRHEPSPAPSRIAPALKIGIPMVLMTFVVAAICFAWWSRSSTANRTAAVTQELPEPAANASEREEPPSEAVAGQPAGTKVARTLDQAEHAIVKFEIPLGIGNLTRHGTGFVVDGRGWVVTNDHVVSQASTDARLKLADGQRLEIEGIIARSPQRDLAIVKIQNPPDELTVLDVGFDGRIPLGSEVFAFGHPYDAEFSLSKGIVSRNLTTADWLTSNPGFSPRKFPPDMMWIQHDAKISPGNSGGPLLDAEAHVFGLNTFVHVKAEFGYASHVKYLRDMMASVSDKIEPLPPPQERKQTNVSSRKIAELSQQADSIEWTPHSPQQYDVLAELGMQMTLAKHASLEQPPTTPRGQVTHRVAKVADQQFAALQQRTWTQAQIDTIRNFAVPALNELGGGFFASCTFIASLSPQKSWVAKIDGTQEFVLLRGGKRFAPAPTGTRCLVLGMVLPQMVNVKIQNKELSLQQRAPVVLLGYALPLRQRATK